MPVVEALAVISTVTSLVGKILEDRKSQREYDLALLAMVEDKDLIKRYVETIIKREEMTTNNLSWWQENLFDHLGDLVDGDLIAKIKEALEGLDQDPEPVPVPG